MLLPEFKNEHPNIPWSLFSGLRHRLVHNYDSTNWSIIVDIVFDELPAFAAEVKKLTNAL